MKTMVAVRVRKGVDARQCVTAAAATISNRLEVRPYLSPPEQQRAKLAYGLCDWAKTQPQLAEQCSFAVRRAGLFVKAGPRSEGQDGEVPYPLWEHVERGELVDLDAEAVLLRVGRLISLSRPPSPPGRHPSPTGSRGGGERTSPAEAERNRTRDRADQTPGGTPAPAAKTAKRVHVDGMLMDFGGEDELRGPLAAIGYGDMAGPPTGPDGASGSAGATPPLRLEGPSAPAGAQPGALALGGAASRGPPPPARQQQNQHTGAEGTRPARSQRKSQHSSSGKDASRPPAPPGAPLAPAPAPPPPPPPARTRSTGNGSSSNSGGGADQAAQGGRTGGAARDGSGAGASTSNDGRGPPEGGAETVGEHGA